VITDRRLLAQAIAAGLVTPDELDQSNRPAVTPDPPEWADPARRIAAAIAMCASGAPASLPPRPATIDGRRVPAPPGHRRRWRRTTPRTGNNVSKEGKQT